MMTYYAGTYRVLFLPFFYNGRVHRSVEEIPITNSHEWGIFILCSTLIRLYTFSTETCSVSRKATHTSVKLSRKKRIFFYNRQNVRTTKHTVLIYRISLLHEPMNDPCELHNRRNNKMNLTMGIRIAMFFM